MDIKLLKRYLLILCIIMIVCKVFFPSYYTSAVVVFMLCSFPVLGIIAMQSEFAISYYIEQKYPAYYKSRKLPNQLVDTSALAYSKDKEMLNDEKLKTLLNDASARRNLTGISFALVVLFALVIFIRI